MKDAKGHGSDTRGMRLVASPTNGPHMAKVYRANPNGENGSDNVVKFFPNGQYRPQADYHTDDLADAHSTAKVALERYATQDLATGNSKSAPAPIHDAMKPRPGYNEHGSRHGYSPDAVNSAIAAQNRSGRGKIGGREGRMIHALLKGR